MTESFTGNNSDTIPHWTMPTEENSCPRNGKSKLTITESDDSRLLLPNKEDNYCSKQYKAGSPGKRMTGKSTSFSDNSQRFTSTSNENRNPNLDSLAHDSVEAKHRSHARRRENSHGHGNLVNQWKYQYEELIFQISEWLEFEKDRRALKEPKILEGNTPNYTGCTNLLSSNTGHKSVSSTASLERLQNILDENIEVIQSSRNFPGEPVFTRHRPSTRSKKRSHSARKNNSVGSDTDSLDGEVVVPRYNTFLDNSKTMSYSDEAVETSTNTLSPCATSQIERDKKAWIDFKVQILKLAHSLQLKGWKKIPFEYAGDINVERLSGALTNAVYVISPPQNLLLSTKNPKNPSISCSKVLLRIYGPQVDHLIDRENELSILRRLSRKKIGPRMLGTFKNGRFEEFFNAKTLTNEDLRKPDTSQQIAKRMRELHDGVDLLEREREEGPFVWKNWDRWVDHCEKIMNFLDGKIKNSKSSARLIGSWRYGEFVCGVEWPKFKLAVEKYRKWLNDYYGQDKIKQSLVFAHNDVCTAQGCMRFSNLWQTQYGNILRLIPETNEGSSPSPLLLPTNTHKQLVVIDFEYASANTPGLEFANHFTEWCYNYHSPIHPWLCDTSQYPTREEQIRFIRSYVNHQIQLKPFTSGMSETNFDSERKANNEFLLENRTPNSMNREYSATQTNISLQEICSEIDIERRVQELLNDVRLWRAANSAQWVAWGIVQAHVPGLDLNVKSSISIDADRTNTLKDFHGLPLDPKESAKESHGKNETAENRDEFDYLSYASDRTLLFWGDMIGLGIIAKKELPCELMERIKILNF